MTPDERLEAIRQAIDDEQMSELDPASVVAMQMYYVMALSLNRIANHFDTVDQQGA
ncbi:hypothetical protein [Mycolicibacterium fortuitum]|uniref:hypothetical protein n=1 Tax=Mycolicibacterium fortuitum TaxID=1766 RepID=UPI0014902FEA|nr:hypothetical protein [Mycolicibacterium fortuitum]